MTEKQAAELLKYLKRIAEALEKQTAFITSPRYVVGEIGPESVTKEWLDKNGVHWYEEGR